MDRSPNLPSERSRHPTLGVMLVLAAALLWGTTGTAQSLVPTPLSSSWVGALRLVMAALLFFTPMQLLRRRHDAPTPASAAALPWRGIAGAALCMTAYNLAFFAGVRACGVAVGTAVALGSGPLWAGLLDAALQRRRPTALWWLGTTMAVGGVVLMVGGPQAASPAAAGALRTPATPAGLALCLTAGWAYAAYTQIGLRMVGRAAAGTFTAAVFGLAALLALPLAGALAGPPQIDASALLVTAWLGVMSTGLAYLMYSHALRHISGATAVALALGEPVTAFVLAVLVVGERPGLMGGAGLLAVLAGLVVVVRAELRHAAARRTG